MECKLSQENTRLISELKKAKEDIAWWKEEYKAFETIQYEWVAKYRKIIAKYLTPEERFEKNFEEILDIFIVKYVKLTKHLRHIGER
jgi:hypothetical protein